MSDPCIICVAITGSLPTKANNPAVPITVSEQVESTREAFEAEWSLHPPKRREMFLHGRTIEEKRWSQPWGVPFAYSGTTGMADDA